MSAIPGSPARRVLTGFTAGVVATAPMTAFFKLAQTAGAIDELPPQKVVRSLFGRLRTSWKLVDGAVVHTLVGGVAGGAYGLLVGRRPSALSGGLLGLIVWALGYEVVMPAVTDLPQAHRDQPRRAITIVLAHVVYGCALGLVMRAIGGTAKSTSSS